jgi:hypothetical protein
MRPHPRHASGPGNGDCLKGAPRAIRILPKFGAGGRVAVTGSELGWLCQPSRCRQQKQNCCTPQRIHALTHPALVRARDNGGWPCRARGGFPVCPRSPINRRGDFRAAPRIEFPGVPAALSAQARVTPCPAFRSLPEELIAVLMLTPVSRQRWGRLNEQAVRALSLPC